MRVIILTLLFVMSSFGYGVFFLQSIRIIPYRLIVMKHVFTIALGMGITSLIILITGLSIGFNLLCIVLILTVGFGLCVVWLIKNQDELSETFNSFRNVISRFKVVEWLLVIILTLMILYPLFAHAVVPPLSYDELAYHLAIPKIFMREGRITYIDFIPYSNWPMGSEMLYGMSLILKSETMAHLISWLASILTGIAIMGETARILNRRISIIAGIAFFGTGVVFSISGTAMVEPILTLMAFLSVLAFIYWTETLDKKWLIISAVLAGFAASTKFNAAIIPLLLGIFVFIISLKEGKYIKTALKNFIIYGFSAFLIVLPWYLKSWVQTGNPLWGFFMEIFPTNNWDAYGQMELISFIQQPNLKYSLGNFFKAFYLITIKPGDIGPTAFRIGWSSLPLLALSFIYGLFSKHIDIKIKILKYWALLLGFYASWFFQTHQARFFMPVLPLMIILAATGIWILETSFSKFKYAFYFIVLLLIIGNSWIVNPSERKLAYDGCQYFLGKINREALLTERLPGYRAFVYTNNEVPEDAYIWMGLYEGRGYLLDRDYSWANPIAQRVIPLEKMTSSDELVKVLTDKGFTHIIFRTGQPERFRNVISNGDQITELMSQLLQFHTTLLYKSDGIGEAVEVYKINP